MSFSILDRELEVGGSLLLEASAGTGKTFAIEHLVVRLVLEGLTIDQIALVTFTKAAARELRSRIHSNLLAAVDQLESGGGWDYIDALLESGEKERAKGRLQRQIASFDEAVIETIHGFCHRCLASCSPIELESLDDRLGPDGQLRLVRDYMRMGRSPLSSRQLARLVGSYRGDPERLMRALLKRALERPTELDPPIDEKLRALAIELKGEGASFLAKYREVADSYRAAYRKRSVDSSLVAFANQLDCDLLNLDLLLESGLDFVLPIRDDNLKKGKSAPSFPELERVAQLHPLLEKAESKPALFERLAADLRLFLEGYFEREGLLTHDLVLDQMAEQLKRPDFLAQVQGRLSIAIIDEFQDTDRVQWTIFQRLALPLVLVGDPKQSIYRFRGADIDVYLEAREYMGEERCRTLATNYRSRPVVVNAINALFSSTPDLFVLPYEKVEAAPGSQGGEAFLVESASERDLFDFIGDELIRRGTSGSAILVSRWEQGRRLQADLQRRAIPCSLIRRRKLGDLAAFAPFCALVQALANPSARLVRRAVATARLGVVMDVGELASWMARFFDLHRRWLASGLCSALSSLLGDLDGEISQLIECASLWEAAHGIWPTRLAADLPSWQEQEVAPLADPQGAQIVSIHGSKGLEWERVFALGVADQTAATPEELAERGRLLYVALTRAKSELFIPLVRDHHPSKVAPIELLTQIPPDLPRIRAGGGAKEGYRQERAAPLMPAQPLTRTFERQPVVSFSSLSRAHPRDLGDMGTGRSRHTLPRGPETGILLHSLLERVEWQVAVTGGDPLLEWISQEMDLSPLKGWAPIVAEMIEDAFHLPLNGFSLAHVDPSQVWREMEFLLPNRDPGALFGVIDLSFAHENKVHIVDWKSNWLEEYSEESLVASAKASDYPLQAAIYRSSIERLLRNFPKLELGEVFYLYLRGPSVLSMEV